jgi:hypothetical protein
MGKHTVRCHPPLRNGHAVVVIPSTRPARPLAVRRRTPVPRTARTRSRPHGGRTGCFPSLCKPRSAPTNDRSIPPWRNRQTRARCAGAARASSRVIAHPLVEPLVWRRPPVPAQSKGAPLPTATRSRSQPSIRRVALRLPQITPRTRLCGLGRPCVDGRGRVFLL